MKPKTFEWTGVQLSESDLIPIVTLFDGINTNATLVFKNLRDFERFATAISVAEYHAKKRKAKKP